MKRGEVFNRVADILVDLFLCDKVDISNNTVSEQIPGWDSLSHTILLVSLSNEFGIQISEENKFSNIGELVAFIFNSLNKANNEPIDDVFDENKVKTLLKMKEFEKAIKYLETILMSYPENLKCLQYGFRAYMNLQQYEQAGRIAEKALSLNSNNFVNIIHLGLYHSAIGNSEQAILLFKRALEIKPNNLIALTELAKIYFNLKDENSATSYCNQAKLIDPHNQLVHSLIAQGHSKSKTEISNNRTNTDIQAKLPKNENSANKERVFNFDQLETADICNGKICFLKKIYNSQIKYCFYYNDKSNIKDRLFVLFHGNVDRSKQAIPTFARWNWHNILPGRILSVFDSTLFLYDKVNMAWYLGSPSLNLLSDFMTIVKYIASAKNINTNNIITLGSSGGGFAAIRAASILGCSALVVNPQLNILNYRGFSKKLETAYGDKLSKLFPMEMLDVSESILKGKINKLVYAQNIHDDLHYNNYFLPLKAQLSSAQSNPNIKLLTYEDKNGGHSHIAGNVFTKMLKGYFLMT
ncbi:MAG TPA: hypothetical protein DD381_10230 [Lentisphaeria bacterium]|nr:MAG: hypothetical protein A2X47_12005 [Lentisphaerae bacterium GWF2_38_69]HBM16702.1 hypothetical protein [Lentisphaeria bacterium]